MDGQLERETFFFFFKEKKERKKKVIFVSSQTSQLQLVTNLPICVWQFAVFDPPLSQWRNYGVCVCGGGGWGYMAPPIHTMPPPHLTFDCALFIAMPSSTKMKVCPPPPPKKKKRLSYATALSNSPFTIIRRRASSGFSQWGPRRISVWHRKCDSFRLFVPQQWLHGDDGSRRLDGGRPSERGVRSPYVGVAPLPLMPSECGWIHG